MHHQQTERVRWHHGGVSVVIRSSYYILVNDKARRLRLYCRMYTWEEIAEADFSLHRAVESI